MAIRKHPTKGPGWWQIVVSQGRKEKQLVTTFRGTEAEALSFEAEVRGAPVESSDHKLIDVLGRFLDWYGAHRAPRTVKEAHVILPKIIKRIGNRHISLLRQSDYTRYKQERLEDGVTRRTINCELSYLSSLLKYAEAELGLTTGDRPKLYTRRQTLPPSRTPLTPEEIRRLIDQLEGDKKTIVMLYALCGLRRTEGLTLTRREVDLAAGILHVTGKGGSRRLVPIVGADLAARLAEACKDKKPTDYLFPNPQSLKREGPPQPYKDLKAVIKNAAARAGIEKDVWTHLLRHSGATAAIQAGVGLRELQTILGHTDIRMTEIYTHLGGALLNAAGAKMAQIHALPARGSDISDSSEEEKPPENGGIERGESNS